MDSLRALFDDTEALLLLLLVGLVAGWLAGQIMRSRFGLFGTLVIGLVGAFLGGWLFRLAGISAGSLIGQIVAATIGAMILVWLLNAIRR